MIHQLKIESKYFEQIRTGVKTFELRKNDRNYHIGDYLGLNEITNVAVNTKGERKETGRFILARVLNVFSDSTYLEPDYVILSISTCTIYESTRQYATVYDETEHDEDLPYS